MIVGEGLCKDAALVGDTTDYCVCEGVRRQFQPNNNGRAERGERSQGGANEFAESEQKYGGMDQQSRKGHGLGGKIQSGEDARQEWRPRQNIQLFPGVCCGGHSRGISAQKVVPMLHFIEIQLCEIYESPIRNSQVALPNALL